MVTAFCPGHITCFFRPAGNLEEDILSRGSIGAGIRTSLGATVEVIERSGTGLRIIMDGETVSAPVTESVFRHMVPGRGFDVAISNELPCGEGFGMSAAGAIAAALCISEITGDAEQKAFEAAHVAEIEGGGGLGDVSAIYCLAHQPVRVKQGIPPYGEVKGFPVEFPRLTLAVLGPKMHTGDVLGDPIKRGLIVHAGSSAVEEYLRNPSADNLYAISNRFSADAEIECITVSESLALIQERGYNAAMCMLGNSIFSDIPVSEAEDLMGSAQLFECRSTDRPPSVIRKG